MALIVELSLRGEGGWIMKPVPSSDKTVPTRTSDT
jgi:hypothetical protein